MKHLGLSDHWQKHSSWC